MRLLKELFCGWRGLLSLSASILSANLRAIPLRMRYFIFPKSRAASLTARKKWPHIPWRKSRRNCNIVAAVYAGCFPSNIINIAVLVPKAWIASLFSAFNNGSHAKLCGGSVLPCSITLFSPSNGATKKEGPLFCLALLHYPPHPCKKSVAEFSLSPYAFATFHLQNNIYIQSSKFETGSFKFLYAAEICSIGFIPINPSTAGCLQRKSDKVTWVCRNLFFQTTWLVEWIELLIYRHLYLFLLNN